MAVTLQELRDHCQREIDQRPKEFPPEKAVVGLVMSGARSEAKTRCIWPGGPKGKIMGELNGGLFVMFNAKQVIAAIDCIKQLTANTVKTDLRR